MVKKTPTCWFLLSLFLFLGPSCSGDLFSKEEPRTKKDVLLKEQKILIVYLSRTNNTKAVAQIIHRKIASDLVALEVSTPYPEEYQSIVKQVSDENASGYLPPLKTSIDNIEEYDLIFVGFPTWGMELPPPVKSFFNQYDLNGITVVPFNTNAGYGIGRSFETVKSLCPNSRVLEGFSTTGGVERDGVLFVMEGDKEKEVEVAIQSWLEKIGLVN